MFNSTSLIITGVLAAVCIAAIALVIISQQKLLNERKQNKKQLHAVTEEFEKKMQTAQQLHAQEINQLRELYLRTTLPVRPNNADNKETEKAKQIIVDAEKIAAGIIAEAQAKSKALVVKQEQELQQSLVRIVIQVTKKVLQKTLTYEEHRQIILDAFEELP